MGTLRLALWGCLFVVSTGCSASEQAGRSDDAPQDPVTTSAPLDATVAQAPGGELPFSGPRIDAGGTAPGLPCPIEQLLAKHCRACHGARPEPSVPMSLVTYADLTAKSASGAPISERITARVHDVQRPMPPVVTNDTLSAEELKTLADWIGSGTPASSDTCAQTTPKQAEEVDVSECEYLPALLAHDGQNADDDQGYEVPLADDHYECFNFAIPWNEPVQAIAFFPVLDDRRVLHHMGLYALKSGPAPGTHGHCDGGPNRTVVGGWSPGQDKQGSPSEYGMLMPHDNAGVFQLEIHYNNVHKYQAHDRSGLKICATTKFRPKTVAVHVLGSNDINLEPGRRQDVINSCVVTSDSGPGTVVAASPHMHLFGVYLRTVVKHGDGSEEVITDQPYAFADQAIRTLAKPIVVKKGDVLTTTCTYQNTTNRVIRYSQGTDGEMCGNGLLAYPPGSITGGLFGGVLGALGVPNICMGAGAEPTFGL
ncbi:MAG: peptidylglycine alpha-amidating monooxygenase [Myxococcaceae bacterium]|nr:peptidylglycine alpha-amidating monooxygenase [Myxococcaceae bacterium]